MRLQKKAEPGGSAPTKPLQLYAARRRPDGSDEILAGPFTRHQQVTRALEQLRDEGRDGLFELAVGDYTSTGA